MRMPPGLGHVDAADTPAVVLDLRLDRVGDAAHGLAIGGRVAHANLDFVERRRHAELRERRRRDECVHDVIHPARWQAHVARDARHPQRALRPLADLQRERFTERGAGELERRSLDHDFAIARRPRAALGLQAADVLRREIRDRKEFGGEPRAVDFDGR